jgi:DNA-binding XRE family transcriptional regulator
MSRDQQVGAQIKSLRSAVGMSQADLAQGLADHGVEGIYPQTVVKIEQGSRSLKFSEGLAIAAIFGIEAELLGGVWTIDPEEAHMRRLVRAMEAAAERADHAFSEIRQAHSNLQAALADVEVTQDLRDWVETATRVSGPARMARRFTLMAEAKPEPRPAALGD